MFGLLARMGQLRARIARPDVAGVAHDIRPLVMLTRKTKGIPGPRAAADNGLEVSTTVRRMRQPTFLPPDKPRTGIL